MGVFFLGELYVELLQLVTESQQLESGRFVERGVVEAVREGYHEHCVIESGEERFGKGLSVSSVKVQKNNVDNLHDVVS